jgi:hypothetical protein
MQEKYNIDWIILIFNLYAYYLIGKKNKLGFIIGTLGSILGIILFIIIPSIPMIIMNAAFLVLNIINYIKWRK